MRKKLFLHIGFHKTGSTAIQEWCRINAPQLVEKGLLYPTTGQHEGKPYHRRLYYEGDSGPWDALYSEIEKSTLNTILLSDEAWSAPWVSKEKFEMLKQRLALYDLTILCVLRNPVDYFVSRFRHQIRMGSETAHWSFCEFVRHRVDETNEYLQQLELYADVFGRRNVDVLIYDDAMKGGELGRHFLAKCGLGLSDVKLPKSNVHWHESRLKALRMAKRLEYTPSNLENIPRWRQKLATMLRSAGYGESTFLRVLAKRAITCIDHSPLISEDGLQALEHLCSSWPRELMARGWLDEEQTKALAKQ